MWICYNNCNSKHHGCYFNIRYREKSIISLSQQINNISFTETLISSHCFQLSERLFGIYIFFRTNQVDNQEFILKIDPWIKMCNLTTLKLDYKLFKWLVPQLNAIPSAVFCLGSSHSHSSCPSFEAIWVCK